METIKERNIEMTPAQFRDALGRAAFNENWEEVERLAAMAAQMDGDKLVGALYFDATACGTCGGCDWILSLRRAAITTWAFLTPCGEAEKKIHFEVAQMTVESDQYPWIVMWAAATVARYLGHPNYELKAEFALRELRKRMEALEPEEETAWHEVRDLVLDRTEYWAHGLKDWI